ncbi:hypothetical protein R1sor_025998 [Riccia sorocarpa]|uniref:NADP-dependent oxidoreductase domain-containing protein n=1 Tax=Riccia sorocarpa TaxID=122646 RepID=A0ABD3GA74_9MARC
MPLQQSGIVLIRPNEILVRKHRVDRKVPIEITMREMKKLVDEGNVKYSGLSEDSAVGIRQAHAIHPEDPISAMRIEYSVWARDVHKEIIPTCR